MSSRRQARHQSHQHAAAVVAAELSQGNPVKSSRHLMLGRCLELITKCKRTYNKRKSTYNERKQTYK